jgi:hypothetical protein
MIESCIVSALIGYISSTTYVVDACPDVRHLAPLFPFSEIHPIHRTKDGNRSGSDRVEFPCTQNRNPKSKPEPELNTDSGGNLSPKPNPRIPETRTDTRNPNGYPKPADKYTHIHMYK